MWYIPCVSSNLVSIKKLCKDDDVIIEFASHELFVKATKSKEILAQELTKGGLFLSKGRYNNHTHMLIRVVIIWLIIL